MRFQAAGLLRFAQPSRPETTRRRSIPRWTLREMSGTPTAGQPAKRLAWSHGSKILHIDKDDHPSTRADDVAAKLKELGVAERK